MASDARHILRLADEAYVAIREEILRGRLRPGAPLSRRRLARELGMSVVPVADALRRLEDAGLVESRSRAGTRVRVPTQAEVRELYDLREALESQSARLFSERATPAQRRELRQMAEQVDVLFGRLATSAEDADFRFVVHSHHVQFHMRIAEHAGSGLLTQMIDRHQVLVLNWLFDVAGRRTELPPGFHARLADALVSGEPEKADAAMRAHVRYGLNEISTRIGALSASEWRERPAARIALHRSP
jgi:GntR family transcriptional regulator, rspAB operon transcriptional repressor